MNKPNKPYLFNKFMLEISFYILVAVTACIFMKILFNLSVRNFFTVYQTPLVYWGDAYGVLGQTQNMISGGSMFYYPNVSAPFGWVSGETIFGYLNYFFLYIGTLFSDSAGLIVNVVYMLSYPAAAITAAFTLRKLRINHAISFMGALLYTFLPYHYLRNIPHLWLSLYYMVPLVCLVCVWILNGDIQKEKAATHKGKNWFTRLLFKVLNEASKFVNKKMFFAMIVTLLLSIGESYTAFFGAICIIIVSVYSSIRDKSWSRLIAGVLLEIIICAGFFMQLLHTILNKTPVVTGYLVRSIRDVEYDSLKVIQMLLPVDGHRINAFARIKEVYNTQTVLFGENTFETFGIIMTIGFALSILFALFYRNKDRFRLVSELGVINICLVLISTIGGFNIFIAIFLTSVMRCYDRISIYIAFFSLIALSLLLQNLYIKIKEKINKRHFKIIVPILSFVIAAVTVLGLYDQVPSWAAIRYTDDVSENTYLLHGWEVLNYKFPKAEWDNDEKFVKQIETTVPNDSMIFQMPTSGGNRLTVYRDNPLVMAEDIWKPLLHSTTLKWSSGYKAGTESDKWNMYQEKLPVNVMINNLVYVGFSGIYIDTYAYSDDDIANLLKNIADIVKTEPIISDNGRLYFYSIVEYAKTIEAGLSVEELAQRKSDSMLQFDVFNYPSNCFPSVVGDNCSVSGKLEILNTMNGFYNSDGYLTSDPEKVGSSPHLLFGPYRTLKAGTYKVVFDIDTSDASIPDGKVGRVVATYLNWTDSFISKSFSKNEKNITIEFVVPKDSEKCEIHIVTSQANVVFKEYTITKIE